MRIHSHCCGVQLMSSFPSGAVSRTPAPTPARAIASRGEGRVARPRATDEQLVGVGQGGCELPSRKQGVRCGVRCGPGGGKAWPGSSARAACMASGPGCEGWGGYRACAERTLNMLLMSVTPDVSKLSGWLNAPADCRVERGDVRCGARCGPGAGERGPAAAHERHARREGLAVKAGGG